MWIQEFFTLSNIVEIKLAIWAVNKIRNSFYPGLESKFDCMYNMMPFTNTNVPILLHTCIEENSISR